MSQPNQKQTTTPDTAEIGLLRTVMHLLHGQQVKSCVHVGKLPSFRNECLAGAQTGLTAVLALIAVYLSPWSDMVGFAGIGSLIALFGRFESRSGRNRMLLQAAAIQTFSVLLVSSAKFAGLPEAGLLLLLALLCGIYLFICVTGRYGAPGPLIFVFAAGSCIGGDVTQQVILERTLVTGGAALLGWFICISTAFLRHPPSAERNFPKVPPAPPVSHRLIASTRTFISTAVAMFIVRYGFDAHYPAWAGMGALAVTQGAYLHVSMNRAMQRMAGTTIGAMMAWGVLQFEPNIWGLIAVIGVFQTVTEMVIGKNYALGQMFVAPTALLVTHLAAPWIPSETLVPERVLDTVIGAGIGMLVAVVLSTMDDRRYLDKLRQSAAEKQA
ncbi:FUSC family protein [Marinobacterium mangrovicola]|uniref:Fusaric acid resistance family protein n=1 Tax=Marinobacterium mangrovicola TaxID=1476959 RepID=A0A4V2PED5_9GAMM|nr:FUSC family protein [Marinobacterium mangrovicola]TCK08666.1 fusaric acid resistance family protein [Marinobacterium mangrovicola]